MAVGDVNTKRIVNSFGNTTKQLESSFEKLASGKRINKASDDAAGLAIVSALEADVRTYNQASRNAGDGISVANIAEGALSQLSDIGARQQELATQAANGTLSDQQRETLNTEFQSLQAEKSRILETTEFNGVKVFNQSGTSVQVGNTSDSNSQINLPSVDTSALTQSIDISSIESARSAIESLKTQGDALSTSQGQIGAAVSRINVADQRAKSNSIESEGAASRIRDLDLAQETANKVSISIKQNVNSALLAQGNLSAQSVLKLLQ